MSQPDPCVNDASPWHWEHWGGQILQCCPWGCRGHPSCPPHSQAVRLESARPRRVRYLLVVRPEEEGAEGQTALLGVDFAHEG